jgi:hypothetical protein
MKAINIVRNPLWLILSFLFIIISGEHWGGFYLLYIFLSLPHGSVYAIIGIAGIILLIASYFKYKPGEMPPARTVINISGLLFLILSLFLFFFNDKQGYNWYH